MGWEVQNFIREGKAKTESIIKKGVAYVNWLVTISQLDPSLVLQYRDQYKLFTIMFWQCVGLGLSYYQYCNFQLCVSIVWVSGYTPMPLHTQDHRPASLYCKQRELTNRWLIDDKYIYLSNSFLFITLGFCPNKFVLPIPQAMSLWCLFRPFLI